MTTPTPAEALEPPSKWLLLLESRALGEYLAHWWVWRALDRWPPGDGHCVLVMPGFGTSDLATAPLRRVLRRLGYDARGWGLGRNLGLRRPLREALRATLLALYRTSGRTVSLVGWSLGGVFARELARQDPHCVRRVITLGSPINGNPLANNVDALYRRVNGLPPGAVDWEGFTRRRIPPPVPCTAIYSRSDGVVAWRCCLEPEAPHTENVEVEGSHFGLGVNAQALRVIAERLAAPTNPPHPSGTS